MSSETFPTVQQDCDFHDNRLWLEGDSEAEMIPQDGQLLMIAIFTLLKPESGISGGKEEKLVWKLSEEREKPLPGRIPSGWEN